MLVILIWPPFASFMHSGCTIPSTSLFSDQLSEPLIRLVTFMSRASHMTIDGLHASASLECGSSKHAYHVLDVKLKRKCDRDLMCRLIVYL